MIQRIQTLYLLVAELLIGLLFFAPFADITAGNGNLFKVDLNGIYQSGVNKPEMFQHNWLILAVVVICIIVLLATLVMFKNRKLQIKLSTIDLLLCLILSGLIFFKVWSGASQLSGSYSLTVFSVFPVIAAILIFLAIKAIGKDEMLVRSIDRIR